MLMPSAICGTLTSSTEWAVFLNVSRSTVSRQSTEDYSSVWCAFLLGSNMTYSWAADCINQIVMRPTTSSIIPLLIGQKEGGNTSWEEEKAFPIAGLSFAFIEFFQWDQYGYLYLPKVRCKIIASDARPEFIGREALLERQHVGFFLAEKGRE